jgi:predicted nuclease of predicted toxin-antitoxin system
VKLLFDQNLSPKLIAALEDLFPGSLHVREVALAQAGDEAVWNHAADHGFAIVSKDSDFHQRSFLYGPPPKVVWVRCQ